MAGETKVGSLAIDLVGSATSFRRATFYAARDIAKFSNQVEGSAATLNRTFIGLGASAMTFLAVSTGVFASFDDRMRRSLSLFDGMTNEMRRTMATQALAMSSQMGVSANQVADSYYYLASAGFNANESLMLLSTTMKFSAASGMDAAKATEYLSDAAFALGLRSRDTAKMMKNMVMVSDLIMRATAKADATAEQFAMGLSRRAGPLIQAFGVDIKDATASLMVFANQGIKGSQASTWLSMTIRELTRSAAANREEWQRMGVAVYDNTGRMRDFASIFGDLKRMFSGMSDEDMMPTLKKLGIQQRAAQPILALMNASDELVDNVKELGEAAGQTDRIFQERMKSMLKQLSLLGNAARNVGIRIGEALVTDEGQMLLNMVKGLTSGFESLGNWIAGFSETSKRALLLFGGIFPVALVGVNLLYAAMNYLIRPLKAIYGILATRFAKPAAEDMNSAASSAGNFAVHASKLANQLNRVSASAMKSSFSVESFISVLNQYAAKAGDLMAVWESSVGGFAVAMGMLKTSSAGVAKAFASIAQSVNFFGTNIEAVKATMADLGAILSNFSAQLSANSSALLTTGTAMGRLAKGLALIKEVGVDIGVVLDSISARMVAMDQALVNNTANLSAAASAVSKLGKGVHHLSNISPQFYNNVAIVTNRLIDMNDALYKNTANIIQAGSSIYALGKGLDHISHLAVGFSGQMAMVGNSIVGLNMAIEGKIGSLLEASQAMVNFGRSIAGIQSINERFLVSVDLLAQGMRKLGSVRTDLSKAATGMDKLSKSFGTIDSKLTSAILKMQNFNRQLRESIKLQASKRGQDWKSLGLPGVARIKTMDALERDFLKLSATTNKVSVAKEAEATAISKVAGQRMAEQSAIAQTIVAQENKALTLNQSASAAVANQTKLNTVANNHIATQMGVNTSLAGAAAGYKFNTEITRDNSAATKWNTETTKALANAQNKAALATKKGGGLGGVGLIAGKALGAFLIAGLVDTFVVKNVTKALGKEDFGLYDIYMALGEGVFAWTLGVTAAEEAVRKSDAALSEFNQKLNELPEVMREVVKGTDDFKNAQIDLLKASIDQDKNIKSFWQIFWERGGFFAKPISAKEKAEMAESAANASSGLEEAKQAGLQILEDSPALRGKGLELAFEKFGNRMDEIMNREIKLAVPAYLAEMREKNVGMADKMRFDKLSPFQQEKELTGNIEKIRGEVAKKQSDLATLWESGFPDLAGAGAQDMVKALQLFAGFPDEMNEQAGDMRAKVIAMLNTLQGMPEAKDLLAPATNLLEALSDPDALMDKGAELAKNLGEGLANLSNRLEMGLAEGEAGILELMNRINQTDLAGHMKQVNEAFAEALFGTKTIGEQKKIIEARLQKAQNEMRSQMAKFIRMEQEGIAGQDLEEVGTAIKEAAVKALGLEAELDRFKSSGAARTAGIVERGSVEAFRAERNIGVDHMRAVEKNTSKTVNLLAEGNRQRARLAAVVDL
jgi:TP901 family phage tail tape measure protein